MQECALYKGEYGYITRNYEHNGLDLHLNNSLDMIQRETLKVLGWRYHGKKNCWYNRNTPENLEMAKSLCGEVKTREPDEVDYYIYPDEIMVVTSFRYCIYKEHTIQKGYGLINVLRNGYLKEIIIPVFKCEDCGIYYIVENDFRKAKGSGILCCRIMKSNEYRSIKENGLEPMSVMRSFGYTVNSITNLSDIRRREILAFLVENQILSALRISEYLAWFARTRRNDPRMFRAISKWDADREFILSYIPGSFKIRIKEVYIRNIIARKEANEALYNYDMDTRFF